MSLLFSEIKAESVDGKPLKLWESGHPDEYDLRELLQYEARYAAVKEAVQNGSVLHVRHYRFQVNGAEWLAERDHFALIDAYDELHKNTAHRNLPSGRTLSRREDINSG